MSEQIKQLTTTWQGIQ